MRKIAALLVDGTEILPDEILIVILSYLSLKEAVRTSVLSHRWRCLWHFASGTLEFDFDRWNAKKGGTHQLEAAEFESLDVRALEFDLPGVDYFPDPEKLSISRAVKLQGIGLSSLTSLKLFGIHITEKMVEYLLSNCLSLEHLCLKYIHNIKKLSIVGPSLKSLIIDCCCKLQNLTISAANLVSFEFGDSYIAELPIKSQNVPNLSELTLHGPWTSAFLFRSNKHSTYCSRVEKLVVRVPGPIMIEVSEFTLFSFRKLPLLRCLKQLELVLCTAADQSLCFFVLLTEACPFLSRLVIQFIHDLMGTKENMFSAQRSYGSKGPLRTQFKFLLSLVQIANTLEKIIIASSAGYNRKDGIAKARERAKQLEAKCENRDQRGILPDFLIAADMDFIGIQKYFAPKELIDNMKFLDDCGSGYSDDQEEIAEKLFAKYKVRRQLRVNMKLITSNKMELHVTYTTTEICIEIVVRDGVGPASIERLI
ncbi:uncharacterized protein [Coffea arabica]|uniref:F-box domain-containing protein n=1 Tax=Coffea arabica TaxID=13443 RepID=A0A6P6TYV2_COFAR|nr:uncharacterized protein LOC113705875 [Coffea arabica]